MFLLINRLKIKKAFKNNKILIIKNIIIMKYE